jgi:hypothetical protein
MLVKILILTLVIYLLYVLISNFTLSKNESFSNYGLGEAGIYPLSEDKPLVYEEYPYTGSKNVSNNNASDVWWHYPIFTEGSYAQITNNLRYQRNPDNGICVGSEFCGTLYKDNQQETNYTYPLPPVADGEGLRVGYFRTPQNLFLSPQPGPIDELPTF